MILGVGDDAALLRCLPDRDLVAAVDTLVAGRHFPERSEQHCIGHRSLAVNLSDLAAMGAWPDFFLLTIGFPESAGKELPLALALSAAKRGEEFGASLAVELFTGLQHPGGPVLQLSEHPPVLRSQFGSGRVERGHGASVGVGRAPAR